MQIFIGIKKLLRIIGFIKLKYPDANTEKIVNIAHNIVIFCGSTCFFLSPLWCLLFEAETFFEKTISFTIFIGLSSTTIAYGMLLWKREQILELFAHFQSKIRERNNELFALFQHNLILFSFRFFQVNKMEWSFIMMQQTKKSRNGPI